jgi:hypothetical protein
VSKPLKLYVWEDVLCDYTCGMAVALAHNEDEARSLLVKATYDFNAGYFAKEPDHVHEMTDGPVVYMVSGGG